LSARIPLTVVGGYLGAGKTSLVNHLLRESGGLRIAVMVNDFGSLAIDADLIEARDTDLISIAGGCICCSFGSDLMATLVALSKREPRPDHVLIETSGVALPGGVARSAGLIAAFSLNSVVVLADAETVRTRASDKFMGDTVTRQLNEADLILVNKTDLISAGEREHLRAWIAREVPNAAVIEAVRAQVSPDLLLGSGLHLEDRNPSAAFSPGSIRPPEDAASRYESASFLPAGPVNLEMLARVLAGKACGLIRAKGVLEDLDGSLKSLQVVGARWEVSPFEAVSPVATGLACIGLKGRIDRPQIERALGIDDGMRRRAYRA